MTVLCWQQPWASSGSRCASICHHWQAGQVEGNHVDATGHFPILTKVDAQHSKKSMTGSEVRKIFSEARRIRLQTPSTMTSEKVRQNQATMKSHK